jgi:hypothetical protein
MPLERLQLYPWAKASSMMEILLRNSLNEYCINGVLLGVFDSVVPFLKTSVGALPGQFLMFKNEKHQNSQQQDGQGDPHYFAYSIPQVIPAVSKMQLWATLDLLFQILVHFIDPNKDDQDLIIELNTVPGKIVVSEILFNSLVFLHVPLFNDCTKQTRLKFLPVPV